MGVWACGSVVRCSCEGVRKSRLGAFEGSLGRFDGRAIFLWLESRHIGFRVWGLGRAREFFLAARIKAHYSKRETIYLHQQVVP